MPIPATFTHNGWLVKISTEHEKMIVRGRKAELTIKTTANENSPVSTAILVAVAGMADEDVRMGEHPGRGLYWMATHRLHRQKLKVRAGGTLVPDEITAGEKNWKLIAEHRDKAGECLPFPL